MNSKSNDNQNSSKSGRKLEHFELLSKANPSKSHELLFAIKQKNVDILKSLIDDISLPSSNNYQNWLSYDEIGQIIDSYQSCINVVSWLHSQNVNVSWVSEQCTYIKAETSIANWESIFKTNFYTYQSLFNKKPAYINRSNSYEIPYHLIPHISAVFYLDQIPSIIKNFSTQKSYDNVATPHFEPISHSSRPHVTIDYLNEYYKIPSNSGDESMVQSVFQTNTEYYSPSDLLQFQEKFNLAIQSVRSIGDRETDICDSDGISCNEGNLDLQYLMGIAQNTATVFWYISDSLGDPFLNWILDMSSGTSVDSKVNSISWGSLEQSVSTSVKDQFNLEAMKLSLMGVTIVVSSGDNGAVSYGCSTCDTSAASTSKNCPCDADSGSVSSGWSGNGTWTGKGYFPSFPATSPYVTALGATQGSKNMVPDIGESEIACQSQEGGVITSGGGFSSYYAAPDWQSSVISEYFGNLTSDTNPRSGYNPLGRGYPDVSLLGVDYTVILNGKSVSFYGTSCSSPVFAGMITLINTLRAKQGLNSVGFINPTLYAQSSQSRYIDIINGNNKFCAYSGTDASQALECASGFYTARGWDPVTGFGSITFIQLAAIFNITATYTTPSNAFVFNDIFTYSIFGLNPILTQIFLIIGAFLVVQIVCNIVFIIYYRCYRKSKRTQIYPTPVSQIEA